jgi:hypothetical protein
MSSKISEKVKNEILEKYVEPCYKADVENLITERNFWRKVGNYFDTFSKISIGSSSIISFASGIYSDNLLSFFSGTTSVLSLVFMQFASYSHSQSKERTAKLNKLLEKLKIDTIPDITTQSIPLTQTYQQYSSYPYSSSYLYGAQYNNQSSSSYIQPNTQYNTQSFVQQPIGQHILDRQQTIVPSQIVRVSSIYDPPPKVDNKDMDVVDEKSIGNETTAISV